MTQTTAPTATLDATLDEGPTFLKSIAWMTLTLSLLTMGIGGLFYKAESQASASQTALSVTAQ